ncbi:MAG: Cna B-type domain-containing protein, partial [Methanobrevibacter sp.]|uniref:Cna B-type domain-containing protein n=1 Tax=Methanobrevibacter sp. TaxID=66852 RepID=UPI0025DA14DE
SVNVTKVWNDSDDHDGFRPDNVTFVLYADGVENATIVLDEGNHWTGSFTDLSIYKDGKAIVYTVDELSVANYTKSVVNDSFANYTIMNTYVVNFTSVNVTKVWNDSDDHDGFRPQNVTFVLYADGVENATIVLDEGNHWTGSFTDLSIYKDGKAIVYTVDELSVANYTKSVVNDSFANYTIMNTYVVNFTSVNVTKVWNDSDDHDGFRPQNVTFVLYADGVENATIVLDEGNHWTGSFTGLSIYKDGKAIVYTVDELPVANYTKSVTNSSLANYTITNSRIVEYTSVNVTKVWDDEDDHDGFRPDNVTFVLLADGIPVDSAVLSGAGNVWSASFNDLPVYSDGKVIVYSIEEMSVDNYNSSVTNDSLANYTITNSRIVEYTSVNVTKVWDDEDDHDGFRPDNVTFVLLADGIPVDSAVLSGAGNVWSASFNDLPVYSDGKVIVYSIEEMSVDNYNSSVTNDSLANYTITNSRIVEYTGVNVTKVWNDNDNQDGVRPLNVTVVLFADGVEVNRTVLSEGNGWKASFNELPVYNNNGTVIAYTIEELEVANYTVSIFNDTAYNFTINNTHKHVFKPDMSVSKISLNKTVYLGDQVGFIVVVTNTGDCDLTGVYVIDNDFSEGIVLDHVILNGNWTFDGKDRFSYMKPLAVGESANFTIFFNTTSVGFKVNNVTAGNNMTNKTVSSTNNTTVVEEVPDQPVAPVHDVPKAAKEAVSENNATGNPLLMLLLALLTLSVNVSRRKKQ